MSLPEDTEEVASGLTVAVSTAMSFLVQKGRGAGRGRSVSLGGLGFGVRVLGVPGFGCLGLSLLVCLGGLGLRGEGLGFRVHGSCG